MTQEEFDKAPLLDQILYDTTGMLVENHPSIAEAMDKYHKAQLKLLGLTDVINSVCECEPHTFYEWEKDENKCSQCNKPIYKQTGL